MLDREIKTIRIRISPPAIIAGRRGMLNPIVFIGMTVEKLTEKVSHLPRPPNMSKIGRMGLDRNITMEDMYPGLP